MRIIVMSDLHFGVEETSMNDREVRRVVVETIGGLLPVERIILLGDILDLNLAPLGRAIDGGVIRRKRIAGFRQFLRECLDRGIQDPQWICIPGNHDYDTFDVPARLEGMNRRFVKKTDEKILYWEPRIWEGGNIAPQELRNRFFVQYPHRWERAGSKHLLLTHGHYLDPSQTLGKRIEALDTPGGISVDKFFTLCAQYQSLARAISYQGETIRFFGNLYKVWRSATSFLEEIVKYGTMGLLRGRAMDAQVESAALAYIRHFGPIGRPRGAPDRPDAMIFGHTHREGMVLVERRKAGRVGFEPGVLLVNDGGFIHGPSDGGTVGSLVEIDATKERSVIKLHVLERTSAGGIRKRIKEERPV